MGNKTAYINCTDDGKIEICASDSVTLSAKRGCISVRDGNIAIAAKSIGDEDFPFGLYDVSLAVDALGGVILDGPDITAKSFGGTTLSDSLGGFIGTKFGTTLVRGTSASMSRLNIATLLAQLSDLAVVGSKIVQAISAHQEDRKTQTNAKNASTTLRQCTGLIKKSAGIVAQIKKENPTSRECVEFFFNLVSLVASVLDALLNIAVYVCESEKDDAWQNGEDEKYEEYSDGADVLKRTRSFIRLLDKVNVMLAAMPSWGLAFAGSGSSISCGGSEVKMSSELLKEVAVAKIKAKTPAAAG